MLRATPNPPARAACAALQTLQKWSSPIRGDRKGRRWWRFSGVWVPVPNKYFTGVYILLPCLPRLFSVESGFPPRKGLLIFCFVVTKWCLTLQNHAVTGCAGLFIEFEKTPIPCGFAGCSYETACRLMMPNLAILAIKNKPTPTFQPGSILSNLAAIHFLMRCASHKNCAPKLGAIKNKLTPTFQPGSILSNLAAIHFLMRCASHEDCAPESGAIKSFLTFHQLWFYFYHNPLYNEKQCLTAGSIHFFNRIFTDAANTPSY